MPRLARVVVVNEPHHVTQRGSLGRQVFETAQDRKRYLSLLLEYQNKFGLKVWAYCLMDNHVHFIVVPRRKNSMSEVFSRLHMRHAQRINRRHEQRGHLWQGRFYSCVLDEPHLWEAVRYTENNPVRAGIVEKPWDFAWSSAKAHCSGSEDSILSTDLPPKGEIKSWARWLGREGDPKKIQDIKSALIAGKPCGEDSFVVGLEKKLGRSFRSRKPGRPRKQKN